MIRKKELIIGTRSEIESYYHNTLRILSKGCGGLFPPETEANIEFKPFSEQVEKLKNDFGMVCYFKSIPTSSQPIQECKLSIESFFVWIQEEVKDD